MTDQQFWHLTEREREVAARIIAVLTPLPVNKRMEVLRRARERIDGMAKLQAIIGERNDAHR